MAGQGIKAVILDLGNVVVDFNHMNAAERISRFCAKKPKEIFDLFFDSDITFKFEEGKVSPAEFFLEVKKMLGLNLPYESFVPIWNDIFYFSPKNKAVYALASRLKDRYKLMMLSNINILHYEYLKERFPVFNIFHHVFTSCELGVAKPKEEIYRKSLEISGFEPGDVFYTDDRAELVESAKKVGIRGFVFTGAAQLIKDLEAQGVDVR